MNKTDKDIQGNASISRNLNVGSNANINGDTTIGHNLFVKGWVDAPNIKGALKGLYATEESLSTAYPSPKPGWFALVGNTLPAAVYRVDGGKWVATGETGGEFNLWIDKYEADITELSDKIAGEVSAREEADTALGVRIDAEKTAREEGDTVLQGNIDAEAEARKTKDAELSDKIAGEVSAREEADTALGVRIDAEKTAREEGDTVLQGNIDAEAEARKTKDAELSDKIAGEVSAREEADTALGVRIDAEKTAREEGDTVLQGNIDNINWNTGISFIPEFSETKDYAENDFVIYNGTLYRFIMPHNKGPFNRAEITGASITETYIVQEKGYNSDSVMSQKVVTEELRKISTAIFDDIVDNAVIKDGFSPYNEVEVVYVRDKKIFVARDKDGEYHKYWGDEEAYNNNDRTAILKDKIYLLEGQIYTWDDKLQNLSPYKDSALYQVEETDYFPDYVDTQIRGYDGDGHSVTVKAATKTEAGVMSSADKTALDALALYNAKSVITVAGMDFTHGDILDILKGHRPTRYAVKYETETSSYVCGILDAYTSRDGRVFTEIYTGGCDLAKDFTGGTHDSGRIYQFMRQYRIFGSGTPAAGTWSAWKSCLSSATMEELSAMGLDYEVFEGETDGYIEVKLTGKDGGVVGGSTEIPFASAAKSGFMSKEDKARLDGMETGANRTVVVQGYGNNAASVMSQAAVTQADNELLKRLQGVSDNSNPYTDPFVLVRFAGDDFLEQFNTWLDDLHTITSVSDARKAGFFRVNLYGSFCEVKNIVLSWEAMKFQQIVEGNVYIDGQGKVAFNDNRYTILQRRYDGSAWSEWQEDAYETRKTIADDLRTAYTDKGVSLNLYNGDTRLFGDSIAAATQDKAGVMSAEDKRKLDEMKDTVVFTGATVDEETETLVLNRVDGETLVLDEVGGSLPGGITKVSQLENDKGYLTGAIDDERITFNND